MSALDEWRQIALASLGLPDDRLLDVLKLVERVPDRGRMCEVLDRIRPRLVQLRPPRPLNAQRLLFRPVEDLFDPPDRYRAKIGRLSRQTIQPCWTIVQALIDPALLQRTNEQLPNIDNRDTNEIYVVGLPFWRAAGEVLAAFLAADTTIGRRRVGSEQVTITEDGRQQLTDIADILSIAAEVETVKMRLPERPIRVLSQADTELLVSVLTRLAAESTRKVQTFFLVMLARMAKPGDLLQVLEAVSLPCSSNDRAALVKAVGTNALASLTFEAQDLRQLRGQAPDPVEGAKTAELLVNRLTSLERSLGGLRDRTVANQVQTARREIGAFMLDSVVGKADQNLFQHLAPRPDQGAATGATEPTIEQVENAEKCAASLRRCARVADAVGVRKEVEKKLSSICEELERQATTPEADETAQSRRLIRSVRLIEMIAGPDEAQRVMMAQFAKQSGQK